MKTHRIGYNYLLIFLFLFCQIIGYSQVPQEFSYQAIIRDGNGIPITNKTIGVRITLQDNMETILYSETHSPTSNGQGLINLNIGGGTQVGDKTFSSVPWSSGDVFIKIEVDPEGGTNYTQLGTQSKLLSVPYALLAKDVKEVVSQPNALDDDPIFEVKNKNGQVVFGVYQGGVRIYVDDSQIKGVRGGFAIGGLTNQAKGQQEYFRITPDSARLYVKEVPTAKGVRGGFAIGGLTNQAKTVVTRKLMFVAPDSTRFWVNENVAKGVRGGFAIGGLTNQAKGAANNFMQLTTDNYFIGEGAGISNTSGKYNSFMGYQNGYSNTTGSSNVYLGYQSGYDNKTGENNTFIGNEAGRSNTASNNVFIGHQAGLNSTTGDYNVGIGSGTGYSNTGGYNTFIGFKSGYENTTGSANIFVGYMSGYRNTTGYDNIALGEISGYSNETGYHNVFVGIAAGYNNKNGNNNILIGESSGYNNTSGSSNIFLGVATGLGNTTGEKNLFLGVNSGRGNKTGSSNIFLGTESGYSNTDGTKNLFIGNTAGYLTSTGFNNLYIGDAAGYGNTTGNYNISIGTNAGIQNSVGSFNVMLGNSTGSYVTGNNNTMLGAGAGMLNAGSSNIFLGYYAGYSETGSNRLYIANSNVDKNNALIYGEFDTKKLTINGNLGIGKTSPATRLDIVGGNWDVQNGEGDFRIGDGTYRFKIGISNAGGGAGDVRLNAHGGTNRLILGGGGADVLLVTSTNVVPWSDNTSSLGATSNRWTTVYSTNGVINTSDARLKTNIQDITYGLNTILKLRPISFTWKDDSKQSMKLGLIAQDVQDVINEVVDTGTDQAKTLGINYSEIVPVLIKGMQEQQKQIVQQKDEIDALKIELEELKALLKK